MKQEQALKIIDITKNAYELIGGEFADTRNRVWPEIKFLVKKYVKQDDKILDLGCGNGRLLKSLPEVSYWGLDVGSVLLVQAEKLANELNFRRVNFERLDMLELNKLNENNFDVVFMLASFNHLPSQKLRLKVLVDIKKLLKPNGLLIMTNWNMWQWKYKKSIWYYKSSKIKKQNQKIRGLKLGFKDVITVWQNGTGSKKVNLYYRAFTRRELKKMFRQTGFQILENYYSSDGHRTVSWRAKNIVTVGRLTK